MTGINKVTIRKRITRHNIPHHRGKTKQRPFMLDEVQLRRFLRDYHFLWHHKNLTINLFSDQKWYLDKVKHELEDKYIEDWYKDLYILLEKYNII